MYSITLHRVNVNNLLDSKPQMFPRINQEIKFGNTTKGKGRENYIKL